MSTWGHYEYVAGNAEKYEIVDTKMVPFRGVEPPTHALRMRCSTN